MCSCSYPVCCPARCREAWPSCWPEDYAAAAAEDVVVSYTVAGLDPKVLREEIARQQKPGDSLNDSAKRNIAAYDMEMPGQRLEQFDFEYNGTIIPRSTGLSVVLPKDEVQTSSNWWRGAVATLLGVATGIGSGRCGSSPSPRPDRWRR
ncbi:hypothetical protein [Streptomyces sp. S.PNR 29]|uniref:hypothetical protein n=1 Tax=Streptomyces sp. S.PNR 29 TaxID=2973805 RepID=UPI0025B0A3FA|nr:hypothetical protein [Streptomyces sp. S.PNR 29]MDN0200769.1 hypothetical protein [Streptomyces sp. S.PNR 29]